MYGFFVKFSADSVKERQNCNGRVDVFSDFVPGLNMTFIGGPFRYAAEYAQRNLYAIKMAVEQPGAANHTVALADFTAPTEVQLIEAAEKAIFAAIDGQTVYIGCAGGIGRTGTMMAAILKVFFPDEEPVAFVREMYLSHAVETKDQRAVLAALDVRALRKKVQKKLFWKGLRRKFWLD